MAVDWPCRAAVVALVAIGSATGAYADSTIPLETPKPISAPPLRKQFEAMQERMNKLQLQINNAKALAQYGVNIASCVDGGLFLVENPDTGDYTNADTDDPNGQWFATLDPGCAS